MPILVCYNFLPQLESETIVRRWLTLALGFAFSAFFTWLGFRQLNLEELVNIIGQIRAGWLVVAILVYQIAAYIITWRWYFLLRPVKEVSPNSLFPIVMMGYTGNNIYPARIGELLRAYVLKRDEGIDFAPCMATIIVERIFDGLVMLTFVLTALLFVDFKEPAVRTTLLALTPLFFGALAVFSVMTLRPEFTRRVYTNVFNRILPVRIRPRITGLAERFMNGLETLRTPHLLALTWIFSFWTWGVEASTYWIVLRAFDFTISFWVLVLVMGLANLTTILPSTPGYFGTFHGVVVLTLGAFDVDRELAGAYAIVMHMVLWLPVTLLGIMFLVRRGLGWRAMERAGQLLESEVTT